jgi:O-antigen/teichoic acid export membrane protein
VKIGAVPSFFIIKIIVGIAVLKVSAASLSKYDFMIFSQIFLLSALLNMIAVGGAQTGLIRQVASASHDRAAIAKAQGAAFGIWAIAVVMLGIAAWPLAGSISILLTGDATYAWTIPLVVLLSLLSGPGQIYGAILTGSGHAAIGLTAQAIGLVMGSVAALILLRDQLPVDAVMAFTLGPVIAGAISGLAIRRFAFRWLGSFADVRTQISLLMRYSGAFVVTASFSPLSFFVLRYFYREAFGAEALNSWLVASRISDTTTQLLGLFMVQIFLPMYTRADGNDAWKIVIRSWVGASAAMSCFLVAFLVAPELIVRTFLSPTYLPAIPAIRIYMLGDILRVSSSLLMFAAFARGRLMRYIGIEFAVAATIFMITIGLIAAGRNDAPFVGYFVTHLVATVVLVGGAALAAYRAKAGTAQ